MLGLLTTTITIALIVTLLAFNANQQATAANSNKRASTEKLRSDCARVHDNTCAAAECRIGMRFFNFFDLSMSL